LLGAWQTQYWYVMASGSIPSSFFFGKYWLWSMELLYIFQFWCTMFSQIKNKIMPLYKIYYFLLIVCEHDSVKRYCWRLSHVLERLYEVFDSNLFIFFSRTYLATLRKLLVHTALYMKQFFTSMSIILFLILCR